MTESPRNDSLAKLYRTHWPTLRDAMVRDDALSAPFLAWVSPDYERAKVRLVVVGKETNGWSDRASVLAADADKAVEALMREYRAFALGDRYSGAASYWNPVRELYRRLNPDGPQQGFVALNASKMDRNGSTPGTDLRDVLAPTGLLPAEIRILDPHVVVFHTGPQYEHWLDAWFPRLERSGDRWLARLTAPGLPSESFRTYHPRYLNYRSRRRDVYDAIVASVIRPGKRVW